MAKKPAKKKFVYPKYEFKITIYDYGPRPVVDGKETDEFMFEKNKVKVLTAKVTRKEVVRVMKMLVKTYEGWGIEVYAIEDGKWEVVTDGAFDPEDPDTVRDYVKDMGK